MSEWPTNRTDGGLLPDVILVTPEMLEASSIRAHAASASASNSSSGNATAIANDGPAIIVRTEEVLIVLLVLILWVGAIALFFNRWGKIRMLEPYQPKFQHEQHRTSCPLVDIEALSPITGSVGAGVGVSLAPNHHAGRASFSRMSMGCSLQIPPASHFGSMGGSSLYAVRATPLHSRARQNSVFANAHSAMIALPSQSTRKTRSAMDLSSMVLDEAAESV